MLLTKRPGYSTVLLLAGLLAGTGILGAGDGINDIAKLKAQIAAQQKQFEALQQHIAEQKALLLELVSALTFFLPPCNSIIVILLRLTCWKSAGSVFLREEDWFFCHSVGRPPDALSQAIAACLNVGEGVFQPRARLITIF